MREIPRRFVSLSVAYVGYMPQVPPAPLGTIPGPVANRGLISEVLSAVADDGTAWLKGTVINGVRQNEWLQVNPLPPRVEPHE